MTTHHALYRFYADDGALLYVGITSNPGNRFGEHANDKPWWHEVRGISMEPYDTREAVLAAERRAIAVENPRYNKARPKPGGKRLKVSHPRPRRLVWLCAECGQPIDDGKGYLHVDMTTVYEVERFWSDRQAREAQARLTDPRAGLFVNLSDIHAWPKPARWMAHHEACDPDVDSSDYWFDVSRARTHAHLLDWTAHLMEKSWLAHTDWDHLIRGVAGVDA